MIKNEQYYNIEEYKKDMETIFFNIKEGHITIKNILNSDSNNNIKKKKLTSYMNSLIKICDRIKESREEYTEKYTEYFNADSDLLLYVMKTDISLFHLCNSYLQDILNISDDIFKKENKIKRNIKIKSLKLTINKMKKNLKKIK